MKTIAVLTKTLVVCALYATLTLVPILMCIGATDRSEPSGIEIRTPSYDAEESVGITLLSSSEVTMFEANAAPFDPRKITYLASGVLAAGLVAFALFRKGGNLSPDSQDPR